MDSQVRAAHIQGRYGLIAAICTAIITGVFSIAISIYSYNYINNLLENINTLNTEKDALSSQILELQSDLDNVQKLYSNLQERYDASKNQYTELENSYNDLYIKYYEIAPPNHSEAPIPSLTKTDWIDQLDIFYQEGKHISGSASDGWCRIWDSSLQKDSLGEEHNHGIYVRGYREDTYILEYILDDSYTGFRGLFTLEYNSRNIQIESNLKVYSIDDDNNNEKELLYSTPQPLCGGIKPISFDIPIDGADHIRIEISSGSGDKGEFFLALVDTCFYK